MLTLSSESQPKNAPLPMLSKFLGSMILSRLEQPPNALLPMLDMFSEKSIDSRLMHPLNVESLISVTPEGM